MATKDGKVLTGLLASESQTAVELIDAEGKKQTLLREDIEELTASDKSLMPEGFEKQVSRKDLTDLLEFLTQRGKYLPLPLDKVATVVSTKGMFFSEDARPSGWSSTTGSRRRSRACRSTWSIRRGDRVPNVVLLHGPQGKIPPKMPKSVSLPCNTPAKAIHLLGGVSGWGFPTGEGLGVDDRPAALRRRQDRGPRAEERRALRRLHAGWTWRGRNSPSPCAAHLRSAI